MRTKKIKLYYELTQKEVFPPPEASLARKDAWLKEIQRSIEADEKFKTVEVTYRVVNRHIEQQRKFFNGPVVDYWTIQSQEILTGDVPRMLHDQARETLLSNVLGYNVQLLDRVERRRKSSADFTETQEWNDFLETLRETEFAPQGYEMPDSKGFLEMTEKYGYDQTRGMAIEQLQHRLRNKLSTLGQ